MKSFKSHLLEKTASDMVDKGYAHTIKHSDGKSHFSITKRVNAKKGQDAYQMHQKDSNGKVTKDWGSHPSFKGAVKFASNRGYVGEETVGGYTGYYV